MITQQTSAVLPENLGVAAQHGLALYLLKAIAHPLPLNSSPYTGV
jgi:hypothetical protein